MNFLLPMSVVHFVDAAGSVAMLLLAMGIFYESYLIRRRSPVRVYLFLLACSLGAFSISRALGHVVKVILLTAGYVDDWKAMAPFSGGINTITFAIIAASSMFYGFFQQLQRARDEQHANYLAEMQRARDFLQHVIDSLNAQLLVIDPKYTIQLANRKLTDDLGVSSQELVGKKCYDIIHKGCDIGGDCRHVETEEHICPWKLIKREKKPVVLTLRHKRKSGGHEVIMEVMAVPGLNEKGEVEYFIETLRDITDKVRMEESLREKEKLNGVVEMATAVAHELNTPMFTVLGNAQLIQRQLNPEDPYYEELDAIIHEVKRMSKLTRRMTRIRQYKAKNYVDDVHFVDIEQAAKDEEAE